MINVKDPDFGAIGDGVKGPDGNYHDDYPAFAKALDSLKVHPFNPSDHLYEGTKRLYQGAQRLYIPAGHYYLSKTLEIKGMSLIIEGDSCAGVGGKATVLRWGKSTTGIRIQRYDTSGTGLEEPEPTQGADSTILRNLSLISDGGISDGTDETVWSHGIHARARFVAEDISVENFAHSGIFIHASVSGLADNVVGNANCFALHRIVTKNNRVAGLWVQGNDTNAGTVTDLSSMANDQYGIYDASFLGNTYVGCHTEANGQLSQKNPPHNWSQCQVSWNNNRYNVVHGQAGLASTTEPGTDPRVWRFVSAGDEGNYPKWIFKTQWPTEKNPYTEGAVVSNKGYRYQLITGQIDFAFAEPGSKDAVWRLVDVGGLGPDYPNWTPGTAYVDRAKVSYEGSRYQMVANQAGPAPNTVPGTNPGVWKLLSDGSEFLPAYPLWKRGNLYLDGGAYASVSDTATNVFVGCYSEAGQPASYAGLAAFFVGGAQAAGTYGKAPVLAGNQEGLRASPGLRASDANGESAITTTVGDVDHSGTFVRFEHSAAASGPWRLRIKGRDVVWDYANLDNGLVYVITGPETARRFGGRLDPVRHAFSVTNLIIGGDSPNARRITSGTDHPGTSDDWFEGDFCFHSMPKDNVLGWSCTRPVPGGPIVWRPVRITDQVAPQADSVATDLSKLVADFNDLLEKMRKAGVISV